MQSERRTALEGQAQRTAAGQIDRVDGGEPLACELVKACDVCVRVKMFSVPHRRVWCSDGLPEDHSGVDEESMPESIAQPKEEDVGITNQFSTIPVLLSQQGVADLLPDVRNRIMKSEHVVAAG